jgi:hypothetical protein
MTGGNRCTISQLPSKLSPVFLDYPLHLCAVVSMEWRRAAGSSTTTVLFLPGFSVTVFVMNRRLVARYSTPWLFPGDLLPDRESVLPNEIIFCRLMSTSIIMRDTDVYKYDTGDIGRNSILDPPCPLLGALGKEERPHGSPWPQQKTIQTPPGQLTSPLVLGWTGARENSF